MNLQFENFSIVNFSVILNFQIKPDIVLSLGQILTEIASQEKGNIIQVAVPSNAPPEYPRIAIQTRNFQMNVSLSRLEILFPEIVTQDGSSTLHQNFESIRFRINAVKPHLEKVISKNIKQQFLGVLTTLHFPQSQLKTGVEVNKMLTQKLTGQEERPIWPINLSWTVGYQSEDKNAFINFGVKAYEMKEIKLPANQMIPGTPIALNFDLVPTQETGVEVVVDINNRPKKERQFVIDDLKTLSVLLDSEGPRIPERIFNRSK